MWVSWLLGKCRVIINQWKVKIMKKGRIFCLLYYFLSDLSLFLLITFPKMYLPTGINKAMTKGDKEIIVSSFLFFILKSFILKVLLFTVCKHIATISMY